jgi:undecaprenyl-diphosphatase
MNTKFAMKQSNLVLLIPLAIFIILASSVVVHRTIIFDLPVMQFLGGLRAPGLTRLMGQVTTLGGIAAISVAVTVLVAILFLKHKHRELIFLVIGVLGAGLLSSLLKLILNRERPTYLTHLVTENWLSFPSGHAMGSSALAIACLFLLWKTRWRWWTIGAGSIYVLAVGVSRVYLGVHYPSDILAGWCVSWLWIGLLSYLFIPKYRRTKSGNKWLSEHVNLDH